MSDDLPHPPWRSPPPRARAPKPALGRDGIVDVALRIAAREGVEGVSMRRVAQEFGTGPSSLYAHVAGKEELLALMIDRVAGTIALPAPDPARWQEQVKEIARATFEALAAYHDLAGASLANIPTGPNALRVSERLLAIMLAGGLPPRVAAWAIDRIFLYVNADAYEGALYLNRLRRDDRPPEEFFGQLRDYFKSLPTDRFPLMSTHAEAMTDGGGDVRFEFGLDLLIDGLARYVERDAP